jgi:hypothetical protein
MNLQGFEPNDLFIAHMSQMGYSTYFTNIEQFKGGGNNLNLHDTLVNESLNDVEELSSTN